MDRSEVITDRLYTHHTTGLTLRVSRVEYHKRTNIGYVTAHGQEWKWRGLLSVFCRSFSADKLRDENI